MKIAIFNDTSGQGHYGCDLVMSSFRQYLATNGIEVSWTHPVGVDWRPLVDDLDRRPRVDAIIVNGEGSIHHSGKSPKSEYLPALAPFARDHWGIPAYLMNATITELGPTAMNDLRAFERIYVRDNGSAAELQEANVRATVVPDLTICINSDRMQPKREALVTDSVRKSDYINLSKFARRRGWTFHPMEERKRAFTVPWSRSVRMEPRAFSAFLASHSFVVTGRYHTVTLALAAGIPFVALESNTPKISWLLQDALGDTRRVVHSDFLRKGQPSEFAQWTPEEDKAIRRFVLDAARRMNEMFLQIRQDIAAASGNV